MDVKDPLDQMSDLIGGETKDPRKEQTYLRLIPHDQSSETMTLLLRWGKWELAAHQQYLVRAALLSAKE